MNVVTTRNGKQVEGSSKTGKEVKKAEPTPPKKEVIEKEDKEEPYVTPPL